MMTRIFILLFTSFLFLSPNSKAQGSITTDLDSINMGNFASGTIFGTGTNFTNGINTIVLVNGSDSIFSVSSTAATPELMYTDFNIPCNIYEGFWELWVYNTTDGWLQFLPGVYLDRDLELPLLTDPVSCHNGTNGYIEVGSSPRSGSLRGVGYTYLWYPNGETSSYIDNLSPGTYSVVVTDVFSGCWDSLTVTLINPPLMNVYWNYIDANCGMQDGIAYVDSISGGIGPYEIYWMPSEINNDTLYNLGAGETWTLSVNDSLYCTHEFTFTIQEQLTLDLTSVNTSCGDPAGSATVTVQNGVSPYSFIWSNGDTGNTADSLATGQYAVQVTDVNGCNGSAVVNITGTDGPQITSVITGAPVCGSLASGSINITVTGGTLPYSFAWSNGAVTEDLINVEAGIYEVTVTDGTGCTVSQCINLADDARLKIDYTYGYSSGCGFNWGTAEAWTTGGNGTITLQWDAAAGNQTGNYAYDLYAGIYQVVATDSLGCTDTAMVAVSDWDGPFIMTDSADISACGLSNGDHYITTTGGYGAPYSFGWSNGTTGEDLLNVEMGEYFITASDVSNCKSIMQVFVEGEEPAGQDICIVTVDSLTGSNLVVWEKQVVTDIDHYNIYREACGDINGFIKVGSVPYDSLSQFIDPGANAMVKSWRYRMTSVDQCGSESQVSPVHKTIHLNVNRLANNNTNITWDNYLGFTYTEQYLWRYHNSTGWNIIDTVPNTIHQYTDTSILALDSVMYFVEVYSPATCVSTRAENHNSTRSNRGSVAAPNNDDVENITGEKLLVVYPNPSAGTFNIRFEAEQGEVIMNIYDLSGRIVKSVRLYVNSGINNYLLNMESGISGIYQLVISSETGISSVRIVKH